MSTTPGPADEDGEVRVGWYSYEGHPHFAHSHDEARALLAHGHTPIDDPTAVKQVAAHVELVVDEPDEGYDEDAFAKAVADEAPKKTTRTGPQKKE